MKQKITVEKLILTEVLYFVQILWSEMGIRVYNVFIRLQKCTFWKVFEGLED